MKKIGVIVLFILFSAISICPSTIANIVERKGQTITIDKGKTDGVLLGLKGIIKAVYKDPSGEYDVNIGLFSVKKVMDRTAELLVENLGSGFKLDDARYVIFDETLQPAGEAGGVTTGKSSKVSIDDLLDQGEQLLAAGKLSSALDAFQKVLQNDSANLIAKEKINEIHRKMDEGERLSKYKEYLKKADTNFQKKDVKYAFLYLAEAYKIYPEGKEEIRKRLQVMDREYPQDFARVTEEKSQEIGDMQKLINELPQRADQSAKGDKPEKEESAKANKEESTATDEPFLREMKNKARSLAKNEFGYWEAVVADDFTMIYIPEGEFTIGSPNNEGDSDEHPTHKVFIKGYWLSKFETTFDQYDRFCRETKADLAQDEGWGRGQRPVINVSWEEARRFCNWLGKKAGLAFRLPTEAEWEKAANDFYPWGSNPPNKKLCNYNREVGGTVPVGSYSAGASKYGVMDLAGNVWEWLLDWYDATYYQRSDNRNPQGPPEGTEKVVRGGSWDDDRMIIRSANRSSENPASKLNKLGFRIVLITKN